MPTDDILKTGILLCYLINRNGMYLCEGEEWSILESIIEKMDVDNPVEFWRLSNRLWRFFMCRNENDLIIRVVDSLGLNEIDPRPGTLEIRSKYKESLKNLMESLKRGEIPVKVPFDDLFMLYGALPGQKQSVSSYWVSIDSPLRTGANELEIRLRKAQERYSSVYMDIIGLIAMGRYQPGDRLPSHEELQQIYGVSIDTTIKAIWVLKEWGVVRTRRGMGIFVAMNLDDLKKIEMDPMLIACHVRRYLDSLDLLSLTIEGVAVHASGSASKQEAQSLYHDLEHLWNEPFVHQTVYSALLKFIVQHIRFDALKSIYQLLQTNYSIGRRIPKLVNREKTPESYKLYEQSKTAVSALIEGNREQFAEQADLIFRDIHQLVIKECKRLGYWDKAMEVYDGSKLWK